MVEIKLSQIEGKVEEFKKAVEDHILKLIEFNLSVGKPRPTVHPLVEAAIMRVQHGDKQPDSYIPSYTLVSDSEPATELTLEDKKTLLHSELLTAEQAAKDKILPPRKMRLAQMQYEDIIRKPEAERTAEENDTLSDYTISNNKWRKISVIAAKGEFDIEDLTEDTVDSWQIPDFG